MNKPEVSVIMPVYNGGRFLEQAVKSILYQTFTDFEFIIIDDGSEDNSVEIIKSFDDPRIKFYEAAQRGISYQLNFGIEKSSAEFIARMDADDLCKEDRLEKQYNFLEANKKVHLLGTNFCLIDEDSRIISLKQFPENHDDIEFMMPVLTSVCHASVLVYKNILIKSGGYREVSLYAEDQELFLRILSKGYKFYNLQEPLYSYRVAKRKITKDKRAEINNSMYKNGYNYLASQNNDHQETENYSLRIGLLEYYHGNIKKARKQFLQIIRKQPSESPQILRHLLITFLGNFLVKRLRDIQLFDFLSINVNRFFKKDFHLLNREKRSD